MKDLSIPVQHIYNVPLRILDLAAPGLFRLPEVRTYTILESASWPDKLTQSARPWGLPPINTAWKNFLTSGKWDHFLYKRTGYRPE